MTCISILSFPSAHTLKGTQGFHPQEAMRRTQNTHQARSPSSKNSPDLSTPDCVINRDKLWTVPLSKTHCGNGQAFPQTGCERPGFRAAAIFRHFHTFHTTTTITINNYPMILRNHLEPREAKKYEIFL